jgi:putative membrane protein
MINSRHAFGATLAALLVCGLAITGCEKAAGGGDTPVTADTSDDTASNSTVPGLPLLAKPVFSPDMVNLVGGSDLFAVAEGRLALAQANAPGVKSFAATSVDTHTKSSEALEKTMESSGQTMSMPDAMPADLQLKVAALQKLTGPAFDKAYVSDQIALQQAELDALRFFAKHGDLAPFKSFAADAGPKVASNLAAAQALQSSLK